MAESIPGPTVVAMRRANTVLLAVFVILKLLGVVDWSWFWVLTPLWFPLYTALTVPLVRMTIGPR